VIVASDATFTWNGGTGQASDETQWTVTGVSNSPNVPFSDDSIVMTQGDAIFTNMSLPGPDDTVYGGIVLFQGGTIEMINSGPVGVAGILQDTTVEVTSSPPDPVAVNATLISQGDSNNDGTIDADVNGTLTFSVLSGVATNSNLIEATNGGQVTISTSGSGSFVNAGTVMADAGGLIVMSASLGGTGGYWAMGTLGSAGGTIEVNTPVASQNFIFDFPTDGMLKLDQLSTFHGDVNEPGGGDFVDLGVANVASIVVANATDPTNSFGIGGGTVDLTLKDIGGNVLGSFFLTPITGDHFATGTFNVGADGSAGPNFDFSQGSGNHTLMTVPTTTACYVAGTLILTDRGEALVEELSIGDKIIAASGASRPIKWIGRRSYHGRFALGKKDILPICFKAGSLEDNVPRRDLWISPHHAMYLEGVLIEAKDLVNGVSVVQAERVEKVEYFHIELETHDVVIAEGALSETFIDDDSRNMFHNVQDYHALYPEPPLSPARYCAPRCDDGYEVEAARRGIDLRAGLRPAKPEALLGLRGYVDVVTAQLISGWVQNTDYPEAPVCLDIYAGGHLIGQTLANHYRADLQQAGLGSGCHSFEFTPPTELKFSPSAVEVRRSLDGSPLQQPRSAKIGG
jgi:hypothetical protein